MYPQVRRDEQLSETTHGLEIRDPYRWLEDPDSEETRKFVTDQNKLSRSVLDKAPARAPFREALDRGLDFPKFGSPSLRGGRYYYSYNPGLANQASLFSVPTLETPHSEATLLIDPNTLSKDGTVALFDASFSEDGRHVSYQLSSGGSDWRTVKVMRLDTETGKGTPMPEDDLKFVKFSSEVWSKDGLGFFYSRYPPPPASGNSSSNGTSDLGTETDSATVRRRGKGEVAISFFRELVEERKKLTLFNFLFPSHFKHSLSNHRASSSGTTSWEPRSPRTPSCSRSLSTPTGLSAARSTTLATRFSCL